MRDNWLLGQGLVARFIATIQMRGARVERGDREMSRRLANLLLQRSGVSGRGRHEDGERAAKLDARQGPNLS